MARPLSTADRVLDSAAELFAHHGYAATSMEQLRRAAGVSNGSLYHHFPRKADVAAHLLRTVMGAVQQLVLDVVETVTSAHEGVWRAVVELLTWVEDNADRARFMLGDLPGEVLLAAEPAFADQNRDYVRVVGDWLREHAAAGEIVERPFGVAHALWFGPTLEFSRHWVRGRSPIPPVEVAPDLAEGAWLAMAAR